MKKLNLLFVILLLLAGCKDKEKNITPSGAIVTEGRSVKEFTGIEIHDGFNLILTFALDEGLTIEANENLISHIETYVHNGTLIVRKKDDVNFIGSPAIKVYISAKSLKKLVARGGGDARTTNMIDEAILNIEIYDAGSLTGSINCGEFSVSLSGGSKVDLTGTAETYLLVASNASKADGFDFAADHLVCTMSGASEVNITVNEKLDVIANGGSIVNYKGNGVINTQILSDNSQINKQ